MFMVFSLLSRLDLLRLGHANPRRNDATVSDLSQSPHRHHSSAATTSQVAIQISAEVISCFSLFLCILLWFMRDLRIFFVFGVCKYLCLKIKSTSLLWKLICARLVLILLNLTSVDSYESKPAFWDSTHSKIFNILSNLYGRIKWYNLQSKRFFFFLILILQLLYNSR